MGTRKTWPAWELLRAARDFYAQAAGDGASAAKRALPASEQLAAAFEALLAAEGSDWYWWFGPEHSSANDAEFDAFFRQLLSEVYSAWAREAPDELAEPIKQGHAGATSWRPRRF